MKGYSFDELVKLAMAAVKRAGDTMTGDLTAPKVLVSGAQGTEANALTRYDYFTSQLPGRANRIPGGADLNTYQTAGFYYQDSNADATSGSNYPTGLAGSLTVKKAAGVVQEYHVYSQSLTFKRGFYGNAWSAWQKVYDTGNKPSAADVGAVSKAGDTMTGNLTAPAVLVSSAQNTSANALTRKDYVDSAIAAGDALQVSKTGDTMTGNLTAPAVLVSSAQDASPNALTRKDYVDGQVATRAPKTHTHPWSQLTEVPLAFPPAEHTHPWDQVTGKPSTFAPSAHTHPWDQVTSKPTTFPPSAHTHPWSEVTGAPVTATRWPEWSEVTSKPTTFPPSAHAHSWTEITSKPATFPPSSHTHPWSEVTGAPATATRWPEWSEVTSKPSTFTPSAHTHTAAQGNADIVASGHSQIGTYMLAQSRANTIQTPGYTVAGSSLRPAAAGDRYVDGQALAGTWKLLGAIWNESNNVNNRTSLWIRIS